ncbi:YL1 nuclear protein-domain-containing protein [Aspergillus ambiguus]|uniref:putative signal transducer n=1 Tax=Aspergillus ambiguus TaxID=176160 RepID=UPI003CCDB568
MADDHEAPSSTEDEAPIESLIQGRAKRATAGRHMSALLDAEADDDLALLFEEVDDDNEFAMDAAEDGGEEDDMGMDSSSDDDDDQGPNARPDDYEGEKQIQKEERAERKKRRAQQDLRFKIASKKVKIDPTAVSAPSEVPSAATRPKKKSERISWIPTPEEGPTRSSSRRQTMQNKEMTHARLKDSEEKRIRLIATMEEAAKRKAQFKPKEMTQAERLAEAERVERLNSKSLNRWEEMEKRKAEERKAKIEALQNRRLEGPVMSYWSGIATWTNGRLTRIGKVNVTPKPEKDETARKKSKKEQKPAQDAATAATPTQSTPQISQSRTDPVLSADVSKQNNDQNQQSTVPARETGSKPQDTTNGPVPAATTATPDPAQSSTPAPDEAVRKDATPKADSQKSGEQTGGEAAPTPTTEPPKEENPPSTAAEDVSAEARKESAPVSQGEAPKNETTSSSSEQPGVEKPATKDVKQSAAESSSSAPETGAPEETAEKPDGATKGAASDVLTVPPSQQDTGQRESADKGAKEPSPKSPTTVPSAPEGTAVAPITPIAPEAPTQATHSGEPLAPTQQATDQQVVPKEEEPQPQIPQPPPVIEQTGRNLTVLENFDDKTAQSREFSIYFNAKKPPRLTKISSSLCVITSLPSRYRDPETSLPFANAYAYHQIREAVAQKYTWSGMLGCYVAPAGVAARGVPARFLDPNAPPEPKEAEKKDAPGTGPTIEKDKQDGEPKATTSVPAPTPTPSSNPAPGGTSSTPATAPAPAPPDTPTPTPVAAGASDPMDVDKA